METFLYEVIFGSGNAEKNIALVIKEYYVDDLTLRYIKDDMETENEIEAVTLIQKYHSVINKVCTMNDSPLSKMIMETINACCGNNDEKRCLYRYLDRMIDHIAIYGMRLIDSAPRIMRMSRIALMTRIKPNMRTDNYPYHKNYLLYFDIHL
jgi:hypothetical protein